MKRSPALASLSRDHQHALDVALRLRRAQPETVADAAAYFTAFFEKEGRRHFEIEEDLVLPALSARDAEWGEGVARIRTDHQAIRDAARELTHVGDLDDPVAEARALGERLADHVRFEERVLFPILERRLDVTELEWLGNAIVAADRD